MRTQILGVDFDNVTMAEAVARAVEAMERRGAYGVTPNSEMILLSQNDHDFARALREADLVLPDGVGDLVAARILGTPLKERVCGSDIYRPLMEHLSAKGGSVFLYGAKPGVAEKAAARLTGAYPGLRIAGVEHGYRNDEDALLARLHETKPDFLMVCLGAPRQELWMHAHAGLQDVGLMMGLGGCLDLIAGEVKRAPAVWQRLGAEWLYRLCQEPSRISRIIKLPRILWLAVIARVKLRK